MKLWVAWYFMSWWQGYWLWKRFKGRSHRVAWTFVYALLWPMWMFVLLTEQTLKDAEESHDCFYAPKEDTEK